MPSQTKTAPDQLGDIRIGPGSFAPTPQRRTTDDAAPLGPHKVRAILASDTFGRPTSLSDEAERYVHQVYSRDRALAEANEADLAYREEEPAFPESCRELEVTTGRTRVMTRAEMMERVDSDFGGSGALWLDRVIAYDRWKLQCLEIQASHRVPQLRSRADDATTNATKVASLLLQKQASTIKDVTIKLGIFMLEIGEIALEDDDAKPLRRLFSELLDLVSTGAVSRYADR